jgi:hypothetical protein
MQLKRSRPSRNSSLKKIAKMGIEKKHLDPASPGKIAMKYPPPEEQIVLNKTAPEVNIPQKWPATRPDTIFPIAPCLYIIITLFEYRVVRPQKFLLLGLSF